MDSKTQQITSFFQKANNIEDKITPKITPRPEQEPETKTPIKLQKPRKQLLTPKTYSSKNSAKKKKSKQEEEQRIKQARGYWLKKAEEQKKKENLQPAPGFSAPQQVHCKASQERPSSLVNKESRILEHSNPTQGIKKNFESEITLGTKSETQSEVFKKQGSD